MRERPILFSGEMVRAILDGRKSVTRRVVKPQPESASWMTLPPRLDAPRGKITFNYEKESGMSWWGAENGTCTVGFFCPYGQPGDRLWVRETWREFNPTVECSHYDPCSCAHKRGNALYHADDCSPPRGIWKPSIHMPRWASRITLEVTGVRVERVQDISNRDILREGVLRDGFEDFVAKDTPSVTRRLFQELWDSLNAKHGFGWDKNPYVWVIEFKKSTPPLLAGEGEGLR